MNAEHRKELEDNSLVSTLKHASEGIRHPPRGLIFYGALALAALLIVLLFRYFWYTSAASASARWVRFDDVVFPAQLTEFVKSPADKGTVQEQYASFRVARIKLALGLRDFGSDYKGARENLVAATESYEQLIKDSVRTPLLHQEALTGAARGREALGDVEDAKKYYTTLKDKYATTSLGKDAAKQLERLEKDEALISDLANRFKPKTN